MLKSTFLSADVFFIFHDFHVHKSFENQCVYGSDVLQMINHFSLVSHLKDDMEK